MADNGIAASYYSILATYTKESEACTNSDPTTKQKERSAESSTRLAIAPIQASLIHVIVEVRSPHQKKSDRIG